ncbi:hypothetical protein FRUB_03618 [Fimbriiglobus ruber]|uniref:Uncharacterized protein n=1 Tax=Fimbriiglobus ruber TaxID=1908690 RepID=A0A225E3F6_9BACT|nr:hypothetical protein FRUB_03618 [Fimbriiglobus ruber]
MKKETMPFNRMILAFSLLCAPEFSAIYSCIVTPKNDAA